MSFQLAAYGVCVEDGRVLLARHVPPTGASRWTLPGGRVEHGEDPFDAVIREVAEETGCDGTGSDRTEWYTTVAASTVMCCSVRSRMVDRCQSYVSAVAADVWCFSDRSGVVDRCEPHGGVDVAAVRCVSY